MPSFSITGINTVAETLAAGELGFIGSTGALIPVSGTAITVNGNNASIINQGTIYGSTYGIFVNNTVSTVSINNSGEILARSLGIYINTSAAASNATIINSGVIRGLTNETDGIFVNSGGSRIVNYGEITMINDEAIQLSSGFAPGTLTNRILNAGTMTNASGGFAILTSVDMDHVTNTGSFFGGVLLGSGNDRLVNSGLIVGDVLLAADADLFDGRGGTVSGSVLGGVGDDRLIGGDGEDTLRGEEGNDTLNGGSGDDLISGDVGDNLVIGGAGNDDLESDLGASTLYGGAGDDRVGVFIDAIADVLSGGADSDTLVLDAKFSAAGVTVGRSGAVTSYWLNNAPATSATTGTATQFEELEFLGSAFADDVTATIGGDTMRGAVDSTTLDNDRLLGLAGDDLIYGMNGDDVLSGGEGFDVLVGGLGRDTLYGGTGTDRFVYNLAAESTDSAVRDVINGFEAGLDRIDLAGIDANTTNGATDDAFVFIGLAAFTGAAGQLRFSVSGANVILRGDVDGDGFGDFSVQINTAATVAVGDLVL